MEECDAVAARAGPADLVDQGNAARVETFQDGPPKDNYTSAAKERADALGVNGVYVAYWKKPKPHIHVMVGNKTERKARRSSG